MKAANKILKNFKLAKDVVSRLKQEAIKTGRTQTMVVEMAVRDFCKLDKEIKRR